MSRLGHAPLAAIDVEGPVTDGFRSFATFVPRFVGFLAILVVGWFVAQLVAKAVDAVLERVGFDRAVERGGIRKALASSEYDASDVVAKIVFYFVFVAALSVALGVLGIEALQAPIASLLALLPRILVALVLVVVGAALATAAKRFVGNVLGRLPYGPALGTASAVLIMLLFAKAALDEVGVATEVTGPLLYAVLATVAGIAIVGVGGGLIKPMQARWEETLTRAGREAETVRSEVQEHKAASAAGDGSPPWAPASPPPAAAAPAPLTPASGVFAAYPSDPIEPAVGPTRSSRLAQTAAARSGRVSAFGTPRLDPPVAQAGFDADPVGPAPEALAAEEATSSQLDIGSGPVATDTTTATYDTGRETR